MSRGHYGFPAYFEFGDDDEISVSFPDLPSCFSSGTGIENAIQNAKEAVTFCLDILRRNNQPIPVMSDPKTITSSNPNEKVFFIEVDMQDLDGKKTHDLAAVKALA